MKLRFFQNQKSLHIKNNKFIPFRYKHFIRLLKEETLIFPNKLLTINYKPLME